MQADSNLPGLSDFKRSTSVRRSVAASPRVRRVNRRLTTQDVQRLVADYQAGVPTTQLTTKYAVGKGTVLRLLDQHGVDRRHQPMTPDERNEATRLYLSGLSLAAVGRRFGREHTVIRDVLEHAGIPRRDTHGRTVQPKGEC